jgi:hypothetical protein
MELWKMAQTIERDLHAIFAQHRMQENGFSCQRAATL